MKPGLADLVEHLERERAEEPARMAAMLADDERHLQELVASLERDRIEEPERLRAMLKADEEALQRLVEDVEGEVQGRVRCAPGTAGEVNPYTLGEVTHGNDKDGEG